MPSIYFGYLPKKKGATKLAVETPVGTLEPTEPSSFKVYAKPDYPSYVFSLISQFLGHFVCVFACPRFSFLPLWRDGDIVEPPSVSLPFRPMNFAFAITRGKNLPDSTILILESKGFTSMKYQDRVVWLKEEMDKDTFSELSAMIGWEDTSAVPQRYLNPQSFRSYLSLISITTRICQFLHRISSVSTRPNALPNKALVIKGYKETTHYEEDPDIPVGPEDATKDIEFNDVQIGFLDKVYNLLSAMVVSAQITKQPPTASVAAVNNSEVTFRGFIESADLGPITSPGKVLKFEPRLALPDPNIISDILGRRFLTCLGVTRDEQFSNLRDLKSGIGALRLTEVGDELAHLYKCIDISIDCHSGCVPFFSAQFYEGCVLTGGYGAKLSIGDFVSSFESVSQLQDDFLSASSHGQALSDIASKFPDDLQERVIECKSMKELRDACLPRRFTSDDRDYVIQRAGNLRFSQRTWPLSPAMLKRSLSIVADISDNLDESCPISRLCLFSNDPVLIGLSVFGEKSAPSWNIPNGALQTAKTPAPPSIPQTSSRGSNSQGLVNDASWVMQVRRTDLTSAVDDFREMAKLQAFRTLPSVQARKQGYLIFSRDRMSEFWSELRASYRQVDPGFVFDDLDKSLKRTVDEMAEGSAAGVSAPKSRKLKF